MADPTPPRNMAPVLAWMRETGSNAAAASKRFRVTVEDVEAARASARKPPVAPRKEPPEQRPAPQAAQRATGPQTPRPAAKGRTAANLSEPARVKLRRAIDQQLDFLSDDCTINMQKERADAARALTSLLLGCPDIMTYEDRTSGEDRALTENAEAEHLANIFGLKAAG